MRSICVHTKHSWPKTQGEHAYIAFRGPWPWKSDKDDVYETEGGWLPVEAYSDDLWADNEEENFQGEEDQAAVQHLIKGGRHEPEEGP